MLKKITKVAVALTFLGGSWKAVEITINDDWDSIEYSIKTLLHKPQQSKKQKIVVLGTGWGSVSFLQKVDCNLYDITIVSPRSDNNNFFHFKSRYFRSHFFYTPLLAQSATGTVSSHSIMEPIRWYCTRTGQSRTNYLQAECQDVDFESKKVICLGPKGVQAQLPYDHLIIAVGSQPATFGIPGVSEHAIFMKEVEDAQMVQQRMLQSLEDANNLLLAGASDEAINKLLHWVVVGGGPTGVELVAEMTDFIQEDVRKYFPQLQGRVKITLLEAMGRVLGAFDPSLSQYAQQALEGRGVSVRCQSAVSKIDKDSVELKQPSQTSLSPSPSSSDPPPLESLPYGLVVWSGGIDSRPLTRLLASRIPPSQQPSPRRGLTVDPYLRVRGVGSVWAIGDCALSGSPPTAQVASQQGAYLGRLFRDLQPQLALANESTSPSSDVSLSAQPFVYRDQGKIAYVGAQRGVAEVKDLRKLWDLYPREKEGTSGEMVKVEGVGGFLMWRSLYFSKMLSSKNRAQVCFDWTRTSLFGREISSSSHSLLTHDLKMSYSQAHFKLLSPTNPPNKNS